MVPSGTNYTWTTSSNSNISGQQNVSTGQASISQTLSNAATSLQSLVYTITPATSLCTGTAFTATISVVPIPSSGSIATNQSVFYGQTPNTITSAVDGIGAATLSYNWEFKTTGSWTQIGSASSSSYSPGSLTEITQYRRYTKSNVNTVTCTSGATNIVTVDIKYPQYTGGDGRGDIMNMSPETGKISNSQAICYNSSVTINSDFDASPIKDATISYRWESSVAPYSSWNAIAGEVSSNLSLSGLTITKKYRRITVATTSTQTIESIPTLPVTITVYPLFVIGSISSDQTICYNTIPATLIGVAPTGSTGVFTYQWERYNTNTTSWESISGATDLNLSFTSGLTATTKYRLKQMSGSVCGIGYTNEVTISVYDNFNAGAIQITGQSICVGTDPSIISSLSDATGGDNSIYYKWQSKPINGVYSDIPGATSASYDPPASVTSTTIYRRLAKDGTCNGFTASIGEWILTVYPILNAAVSIVSDASFNTICAGTLVHFTATPTNGGNSPIYQWKLNGANVGINSSVYLNSNLADGDVVSVEMISNAAPCLNGSPATSNSITFTVNVITAINSQSGNSQICYGDAVPLLYINTTASSPIVYHWYTNTSLSSSGGTQIMGANSSTYQVPSSVSTNPSSNYYYAVVSGACGTVSSNPISVLSYPAFSISLANNGPINICNNTSTQLGVTASGSTGIYTYQWYSNSINSTSGAIAIPGATNSTFSVPGTTTAGDRFYFVKVSSAPCSQLISSIIKVTTSSSLSVNADPLSIVVCNNAATTISGSAIGGSNVYSYLWYSNTSNSNIGGTAITGATSSNFTVPATTIAGNRYYYLVISDATDVLCGVVKTNVATIETRAILQISSNPTPTQVICNNTSATISVIASGGSSNYSYQWYSNIISSTVGASAVLGATNSSFTTVPTTTTGSLFYYVVVTDQTCSVTTTSAIAEVVTRAPLSVGLQPTSLNSICNNSAVTISTLGSGAANAFKYQWYSNGINSNIGGTLIPNATLSSYTVQPTSVNGSRYFYAIISDSICSSTIKTNVAEIYTYSALQISHQPIDSINICNNSSATLSVTVSGSSNSYSYQWYSSLVNSNSGGTLLIGQTSSSFSVPPQTNGGNYYYYVVITDALTGNCSIVSTVSIVHVYSTIAVLINPAPLTTVCNNVGTTISAAGTGTNMQFTYQWFINTSNSNMGGSIISGATSSTYNVPATHVSGNRYFYAVIGNLLCSESISTNVAVVTTRDSLIIVSQPVSITSACNNSTSDLSVVGSGGSGNYSYQWFQNIMNTNIGGLAIPGANGNSFNPPATVSPGDRYFYVSISDNLCSASLLSNTATVVTFSEFRITSQPLNFQVVCNNTIALLAVEKAGGSGTATYQWYLNTVNSNIGGVAIAGASASTYTVPGTTIQGDRYLYVKITDSNCGVLTSNVAIVSTRSVPDFIINPIAITQVCNNTNQLLYAIATGGSGSLTYQWYSNISNSNTGGSVIVGATGSSYVVPATSTVGDRYYYVLVNDATCSTTIASTVAKITTREIISISSQPINSQLVCNNSSVQLNAQAIGGSGLYTYQWFLNSVNSNSGGNLISGATSSSFTVFGSSTTGTRYYYAVITDVNCGSSVTSVSASVTVISPLQVQSQSALSQIICLNTSTNIDFVVSGGSNAVSYQWYSNSVNSNVGGALIQGANSSNYLVPGTGSIGSRYYYVVVTDNTCATELRSSVFSITTLSVVSISVQPLASQVICNNTSALLSVVATGGSGPLTYQWYSNTINSVIGGSIINGATGASYTVPATILSGDRFFYVVIADNNCGTVLSSSVSVVTTRESLTIRAQPLSSQLICNNSNANISVQVSGGSGLYGCQWYSNNVNSNIGGTPIQGANSLTYIVQSNSVTGANYYYAIVSDLLCTSSITSATAEITIIPSLQIQSQTPVSQLVCINATTSVGLTVSGGSSNITYQWYSNNYASTVGGSPIFGANSNQYLVPASVVSGNRYYYVVASDNLCTTQLISSVFTVSTISSVSISVNPIASQTICNNSVASLSVVANGGTGTLNYQWYFNSVNSTAGATIISGATASTFTVPTTTIAGDRYYFVVVSDAGCGTIVSSNISKITTLEALVMDAIPNRASCSGEPIGAIAFSSNYLLAQYSWTNSNTSIGLPASGIGNILGYTVNNNSLVPVNANLTVIPHFNGCDGIPYNFVITVNPTPVISTIPDQSLCSGSLTQPINFISSLSGSTFQWGNSQTSVGLAASGIGNISPFVAGNLTGGVLQSQITAKPISSAGCVGSSILVTTIKVTAGIQDLTIDSYPSNICLGDSVKSIVASIPMGGNGIFNYQWQSSSDNITFTNVIAGTSTNRKLIAPPQNATKWYRVLASSGSCGTISTPVQILVKPKPVITLTHNGLNEVSIGNTYSVKASGAISYLWSPSSLVLDSTASSALLRPVADTRFIVKGTNGDGCSDTASIVIRVLHSSLIYPNNILTPNNDGYNDTWKIKNIEFYPDNQIKIYNSNGILIKEFSNYRSDWDGSVNGNKLPTSTYYYIIKLNQDNTVIKGFLNIAN
jgi:gliding motility-associated-like protein